MQQLHFLTPAFADVARLLHKRTKKGQPFMRTKECDDSFLRLKEALVYAPVLAYLIWKIHMCSTQLQQCWHRCRSISSLPSVGEERVVAYYRQALSKPARNYYTTRHERLAIVKAIDYFHPYLYGRQFTIITDHASLQWLLNFKNL